MKKSLLFLFIASLLVCLVPNLEARNMPSYRPFDWQRIEREIGDGGYELWYPERMEWLRQPTQAIIDEVYANYSQEIFAELKWEEAAPEGVDTSTVQAWYDKDRVILVYPSLQDFTQQRLVPGFMPPGVLGFNETKNWRVAVPYPGSYVLYKNVIYHELAHAWMFRFMKETAIHYNVPRQILTDCMDCPLWFIEGFAELLNRRYNQDYNQDYLSILREDLMRRQICDITEGIPEFAKMMGMDVYSFGYSFLNWVVDEHGIDVFRGFLMLRVNYREFETAWEVVFGKKLDEMEKEWHRWLRYEHFKTIYADELELPGEKIEETPICYGWASYDQGKVAYFTKDTKWGAKVEVKYLASGQVWKIHHMFKDMSLWYRLNNPPIIKGNLVGLVVNREGQDELHIYQLGKKKAKKIKLLREKEILTIDKPSFDEAGTKIVFEGIAPNGFSDLYIWDLKLDKVKRLTNDFYRDFDARFAANGKIVIFASDRLMKEKTCLCKIWFGTDVISSFYQPNRTSSFVDQPIASPGDNDFIAFRLLTLDHSPRVLIWGDDKVYEVFSSFEGVSQIVGWQDERTLVLLDRQGQLIKLTLDNLTAYPESPAKSVDITQPAWDLDEPNQAVKPAWKKKWKYRYAIPLGPNQMGFTSTTGEEIFTFTAAGGGTYHPKTGWDIYYQLYLSKTDLRQRWFKQYTLRAYRYFLYRSIGEYTYADVVLDHCVRLDLNFYYPLNLENGIGIVLASGYLKRSYPYKIDYTRLNPANNLKSQEHPYASLSNRFDQGWGPPKMAFSKTSQIFGSGFYFLHDRIFGSYGEVRRGTWLATQLDFLMTNDRLLEGYFLADARYYLQFFSTRALLANRVFWIKSFGQDRFVTWSNDIYRNWSTYRLGTDLLQLQTEFRFPIANWVAVQPAWMPIGSNKAFGVRVNGSIFWYAGDIWFAGQGMKWTHRAGFSIKLMIAQNISLQHEKYQYLQDGEWSGWRSGWSLNFDF